MNTYTFRGHFTTPLVLLLQLGAFHGFVALDLHGPDAPEIVWSYRNAPSTASGKLQSDAPVTVGD